MFVGAGTGIELRLPHPREMMISIEFRPLMDANMDAKILAPPSNQCHDAICQWAIALALRFQVLIAPYWMYLNKVRENFGRLAEARSKATDPAPNRKPENNKTLCLLLRSHPLHHHVAQPHPLPPIINPQDQMELLLQMTRRNLYPHEFLSHPRP
jgi:hypothetical protein